jgi:hypothetical protein
VDEGEQLTGNVEFLSAVHSDVVDGAENVAKVECHVDFWGKGFYNDSIRASEKLVEILRDGGTKK